MAGLSADTLATATGSGKAAVYRRWPNMDVLLAEAVGRCRPVPPAPDTGSLRGDLITMLETWPSELGRDERALASVVDHARHSPHLRAGLEVAVVQPLAAAVGTVLDQHVSRGHVVPVLRQSMFGRMMLALWWERYFGGPSTIADVGVEALVDLVLLPAARGPDDRPARDRG